MKSRSLHWITKALRDRRIVRGNRRQRRCLDLETLEDRFAPAVFNVNSLQDLLHPGPNVVTLRSAIDAANKTQGEDNTINLTVPGVYAITLLSTAPSADNPSNDFDIVPTGGNLTIANTSGNSVAVDGGFHGRVFDINAGNVPTPFTVTFRGFTIQHGDAAPSDGASGSGGAIRSIGRSSVILDQMTLTDNFATADGGGISMENADNTPWTLTIRNSQILNNHAGDAGGGIETDGQGTVSVTNALIANNTCVNQGAGIWLDAIGPVSANLTLNMVTVSSNIAFNGPTGGIGNAGNGTVRITSCIVQNNYSGTTGGGFGDENMLGNLFVTQSSFFNNYAGTDGGGLQAGGSGTTTSISDSFFQGNVALGNQADGTGGGGAIFFSDGTAMLTNSTLLNNSAPNGGGIEDAATVLDLNQDALTQNHAVGTNGGDPTAVGPGGQGGGLDVPGATATVSIRNSRFVANTAVNFTNGFGGAINQAGGTLSITQSLFTSNVASFLGGGVFFNGVQLLVTASTFNQNNAVNGGGALFFAGSGTVAAGNASTLVNDTLFANSTLLDGGAVGLAPPLSGPSGDLLLLNDTINGNTAGRNGGGIADGSMGILRLQNTIVSGNTATGMSPDIFTQLPLVDGGGNLLGAPGIPGLTAGTDQFGPPNLFALTVINGGPSAGPTGSAQIIPTEFPMPRSLAIGNGVLTGAPLTDERGFSRPALFLQGGVSIGAVEPGFVGEPSLTFVLGPDHQIYGRSIDASGNPTGGYVLTAPGQFSALAVARLEGAGYQVFGISQNDNQVYADIIDAAGNSSGFFLVQPGKVQSIAVGNDASGHPLLFAIGTDNQLSVAQFDDAGNAVGSYVPLKGAAVQSVTLGSTANGQPLLFAIGVDNQVYYAAFDAAGNPLTGLLLAHPGQVKQIAVGADALGNPELFAILAADSQVYTLRFDALGNPVGDYVLAQSGAVTQIAVGMDGHGAPELFVILAADSQVYALKFDASGQAVGTYVLTQAGQAQSIAVGFDGQDRLELFAVMADNQVYEQLFDADGNSSSGWTLTAAGQVLALAAPFGH